MRIGHRDHSRTSTGRFERAGAAAPPLPAGLASVIGNAGVGWVLRSASVHRSGAEGGRLDESVARAIQRRRGGGTPLAGSVRAEMEGAFGEDFSRVRVHTDSAAHRLSGRVQARAFTVGSDIFFAQGTYRPHSTPGKGLLAHELVHAVQQAGADSRAPTAVSDPADTAERQADAIVKRVVEGSEEGGDDSDIMRAGVTSIPGSAASAGRTLQRCGSIPSGSCPCYERPVRERIPVMPRKSVPQVHRQASRVQRQAQPARTGLSQREEEVLTWGARQFGDPQMEAAAAAIRRCRQFNIGCELLVTDDDLWSMYGEYELVKSVFGSDRADDALARHRLNEVAAEAAAVSSLLGGMGIAAGAVAAPALAPGSGAQPPPGRPGGRPPLRTVPGGRAPGAPRTPGRPPSLRVLPGGGTGPAPASGPRPVPAAAAGATVILVFGVMVVADLLAYGAFQRKAFDAGYVYVPSGRSVCMRGCHAASPGPRPSRPFDFPLREAPRIDPTSPQDLDRIVDWITRAQPRTPAQPAPQPVPSPEPEGRRRRRGCRLVPSPPSGQDPLADLFCAQATGSTDSYRIYIESAAGLATRRWAEIDALRGNTWYECKCGYEALLTGAARGEGVARAVLAKLDQQVLNHADIARTCGLEYRYLVSNERVADILRARWFGNVRIAVVPFEPCD